MPKITASYLNQGIRRIKEAGLIPITNQQRLQTEYNLILTPNGKGANSGIVMSYAKARAEVRKKFPNANFTQKQYQALLDDMYKQFGSRLSVRGEKQFQTENAFKLAEEYGLNTSKLKKMSYSQRTELFRKAKEMSSKKGEVNYEANKFTVNLEQLLKDYK